MTLKPILQHYTDTMHLHWAVREDDKTSPIFELKNPIKFSQELILILHKAELVIDFESDKSCSASITGETEYNFICAENSTHDDIIENLTMCLHKWFNQLLTEDIKDLMHRNGEKI